MHFSKRQTNFLLSFPPITKTFPKFLSHSLLPPLSLRSTCQRRRVAQRKEEREKKTISHKTTFPLLVLEKKVLSLLFLMAREQNGSFAYKNYDEIGKKHKKKPMNMRWPKIG